MVMYEFLYFLDYNDFQLMTSLCRKMPQETLEMASLMLKNHPSTIALNTNLCIVTQSDNVCICTLNSMFSFIKFVSDIKENTLTSMEKLIYVMRHPDVKHQCSVSWFSNRDNFQRMWNHVFHAIVSEFVRMSPEEVVYSVLLLHELYSVKLIRVSYKRTCEVPSLCPHRQVLKNKTSLRFIPQMFGIGLDDETKKFAEDGLKKAGELLDNFQNKGTKITVDAQESIEKLGSVLKDLKMKVDTSTMEGMEACVSKLQNITVDLKHSIDPSVMEAFGTVTSGITTSLNALKNQTGNLYKGMKKGMPIVLLGISVLLYTTNKISMPIFTGVVTLVIALFYPEVSDMFTHLFNKISTYFTMSSQSFFDVTDDLFTFVTTVMVGKDVSKVGVMNTFKKLKDYNRVKLGVSTFMQDLLAFCQRICNHIADYFNRERYIFYEDTEASLGSYLEEVEKFVSNHSLDAHMSSDDAIKVSELESRFAELNKTLSDRLERQKLIYAKQTLEPFSQKKRASSWFGQSNREEPVSVIFVGDSHYGKSTVMQALIHEVTARTISADRLDRFTSNPGSEVYSWNWEREHQDGYNRQYNVVIDDLGCDVDVAGVPNNIYAAVIKMINTTPYNLHMAELTSKADSYFSSEIVWMTSNRTRWSLNSMFYNEAFVNRLRIAIQVVLKDGYEPPHISGKSYPDFDHLEFNLISFDKQGIQNCKVIKKIGGYNEVRELIIEHYLSNKKRADMLNDNVKRVLHRGASMRPQMKVFVEDEPLEEYLKIFFSAFLKTIAINAGVKIAVTLPIIVFFRTWFSKFMIEKITGKYWEFQAKGQSELLSVPMNSASSLVEILDRKPKYVHFITECNCPMCSPNRLIEEIQDFVQEKDTSIFQMPIRPYKYLKSLIKNMGFTSNEEVIYFVKAFLYFIQGKVKEPAREIVSWDIVPQYERENDFLVELHRLCDKWPMSEAVPLCIDVAGSLDSMTIKERSLFVAFAIAHYVHRLVPELKEAKTFKEGLKAMNNKKVSIDKWQLAHQVFSPFLPVLGILAAFFPMVYLAHKYVAPVVTRKIASPIFLRKYGFEGEDVSFKSCSIFKDDYILEFIMEGHGFGYWKKHPEKLFRIRLRIKNFLDNWMVYLKTDTPLDIDDDIIIEELNNYRERKVVRQHAIQCTDCEKAYIYVNKTEEANLCIEHPDCRIGCDWIGYLNDIKDPEKKLEAIRLVAQSSTGIRNLPIKRSEHKKPKLTKQSIDISKYMSSYDQANRDISLKVIRRNMLILFLPDKNCSEMSLTEYETYMKKNCKACSILMLGGRIGLINDHVRAFIINAIELGNITRERPAMLIKCSDNTVTPKYWFPSEEEFYSVDCFGNADISVVKFPDDQFTEFSNISRHFVTKNMPKSQVYNGMLYVPNIKHVIEMHATYFQRSAIEYENYDNGEVWLYPVATKEGDCGSMLTICDSFSGTKKICGIHIAGDSSFQGASYPIFQEEVKSILDHFRVGRGLEVPIADGNDEKIPLEIQSKYPYTCIGPINVPPVPYRNRIKKAPLYGIGEVTHEPARAQNIKVDGVVINPTMNALWKNIPASEPLNVEAIDMLSSLLLNHFEKVSTINRERRVYTFDEAILGIEDDPYFRAMTRPSACGFPYKLEFAQAGSKGKQVLFGKEEQYNLSLPGAVKLRQDVEDEIALMKEGARSVIPYEVSEKNEVLPKESVAKGKIRLFAVQSVLTGALKRMYVGAFRSWFAHNKIYNGSAIGMNVYSRDWDLLMKHMTFGLDPEEKPSFIAMDVSKFDGTISRIWMYNFYKIVVKWYNFPEDIQRIQWSIFESHMHSFHIFKGMLFERDGSQSSGDDCTAILNTVISLLYFFYACMLIITKSREAVLHADVFEIESMFKDLVKHIRVIALGDDILANIHPGSVYHGVITEEKLIEVYNKFGVKATTDAKDGTIYTYRPLSQVTFLKRKTYYCSQHRRFIGKLHVTSILKSLHWMRDKDPHYEAYRETIAKAINELALHESNVYNLYVNEIVKRGKETVSFDVIRTDQAWQKAKCLAREEFY